MSATRQLALRVRTRQVKLGGLFILLGAVCCFIAVWWQGSAWALLWVGGSFALVGTAYMGLGPAVFGKRSDGSMAVSSTVILLPYLLFTWAVWRLMRLIESEDPYNELVPGVVIGRRLMAGEYPQEFDLIVDLTCEFPEPRAVRESCTYRCLPILDASIPDREDVISLLQNIKDASGTIYIHCAEGHGRTGTIAAILLLMRDHAASATEAITMIQRRRPKARLNYAQRSLVESACEVLLGR